MASRSGGNAAISPRENRGCRSRPSKKEDYSRKRPRAAPDPDPAGILCWPPCPGTSWTSRHRLSLAAWPASTGVGRCDPQASRWRPFRNSPVLPASPCAHADPELARGKAEGSSAPPRRTGDLAHPAAAQSSRMPVEAFRTKDRKRGGTAAWPDRYAAQISSTIDSEASTTSATSVRPPSNTATSTANRRRSPTSR